jgi:Fe(3+) dicitrate transport protein
MKRLSLALAVAPFLVARAAIAQDAPPPPAEPPPPPPAEPPPPPPEAPAKIPEVRVLGDNADALQKTPGSGTVVTAQEIKRADAQDAAEVLRRVPGVQIREEYSSGLRLDIGVRGLDPGRSRHVLILEDGIPVAVNPYGEPDVFYVLPIERVRGVEVVKGSGNILFGPRTIGGVINFLTLSPPSAPHAVLETQGGELGYLKQLASYGDSFGNARYVVQVVHKEGHGIHYEPFEGTDVFGKLAFDTSSTGEAIVKVGFHDDNAVSPDVGLTRQMFATDPRARSLAPWDQAHMQRYEVSLIHDQRFGDATKLRTLVYAYANTRMWRREQFDRAPVPGTAYSRIVGDPTEPQEALYFKGNNTIQDWLYEVAGFEPRLQHRFSTGPLAHTLDFGGRFLIETSRYFLRHGDRPTAWSGNLDGDERHRGVAEAGYVQDRVEVTENFLVTPGIRVEHVDFHRLVLRQADATGGHDTFLPGDSNVTGVIPGVGAVYGTKEANAFAGVHYGWGPPRIADSFSPNGTPVQVSSEESVNWELGTRLQPKRWVRAEIAGFYSTFSNEVVAGNSSTGGGTLVDGGPTRHFGVEALGVFGIGRALKWPTILDLGLRYTFARAVFTDGPYTGFLVPYAPLHTLSANVDVEHASGVGGQLAYYHSSSQFSDFANTVAENATGEFGLIPQYDVVDVTAHYRNKPTGLTVKLTVKNLFDQPYIVERRPQGIDAAGFRQILVGLRWEYDKAAQSTAPAAR